MHVAVATQKENMRTNKPSRKIIRSEAEEVLRVSEEKYRKLLDQSQNIILRLQQELTQSHKMAIVGRFAGSVAHDFNNLLSMISGSCDLLRHSLGEKEQCNEHILEIEEAVEKAALFTRQLFAFSRQEAVSLQNISLNEILTGLKMLLQRLVGSETKLILELEAEAWHIKSDRAQLEQVVMNLAANARDAMPSGGELTLKTENVLVQANNEPASGMPAGPFVKFTVADTGHGMDQQIQSQIFEPFFTTKEAGSGTGLGLATVYRIVKENGGYIFLQSEPSRGTTFTIYLPRL